MQQVPPETSRRTGRPPAMREAMKERSDKPQVKAKVYMLDGLPVDTEADIVEGDFLRAYDNLGRSISRTSKGGVVTDWTQPKIPVEIIVDYSTRAASSLPMHRSRAPYRCSLFKTVYICRETGFGHTQGYSSSYDLVFKSARGLQCTWLIPRTRASSDGVDYSDLGEWIYLKRGVDCRGCGLIGLRRHRIMLCGGTTALWRARRGLKLRIWTFPSRPTMTFCVSLHSGVEAALMCLDSLRLTSFARNPHVVLPRGWALILGTYSLVPRGTQIPYSAAVDLVTGLEQAIGYIETLLSLAIGIIVDRPSLGEIS
ncbi:hypothetical protein M9H77_03462 [Catharanthus roseus]|uniref:Uncharacterized protein n=1 Tax=Catharanthus roseus TaxID=4058 RepID=A0ACC0CBA2_CATRO|nr:hypothetical protein M9H77_03462 [Catharanthus roseus]